MLSKITSCCDELIATIPHATRYFLCFDVFLLALTMYNGRVMDVADEDDTADVPVDGVVCVVGGACVVSGVSMSSSSSSSS